MHTTRRGTGTEVTRYVQSCAGTLPRATGNGYPDSISCGGEAIVGERRLANTGVDSSWRLQLRNGGGCLFLTRVLAGAHAGRRSMSTWHAAPINVDFGESVKQSTVQDTM